VVVFVVMFMMCFLFSGWKKISITVNIMFFLEWLDKVVVMYVALSSSLCHGLSCDFIKSIGSTKRASVALFCLFLLTCSLVVVSCSAGLADIHAGSSDSIVIGSDGVVVGTDKIQRQGDVYTFTGDISASISVKRSGVTIDGAGYALKGWGNAINLFGEGYACRDVVVKNVRFCAGVRLYATSTGHSFINNTFEGGGIETNGGVADDGKCNVIKYNVFIDSSPAIWLVYTNWDVISENNFFNCTLGLTFMSGHVVDRNYWSDYVVLYPDAKEVGSTGVWDLYYRYAEPSELSFVDYHPLVSPVGGAGVPSAPVNDEEQIPILTVPVNGEESSFFPIVLIAVVGVVSVVVMSTSLLIYFKKHK
jgi:hypothetical protein